MTKIRLDYPAMRTSALSLRTAESALRAARHALVTHEIEQGAPPAVLSKIRETTVSVRNRIDYVADSTDRMHRLLNKRADRAEFLDGGTVGAPGLWLPHLKFTGKDKGKTRFNGEEPGTEWRKGKDGRWTKHVIPPERMGVAKRGPDKDKPWKPGFLGFEPRGARPGDLVQQLVPGANTILHWPKGVLTSPVAGLGVGAAAAAAAAIAAGRGRGPDVPGQSQPDRDAKRAPRTVDVFVGTAVTGFDPNKIVTGGPLKGFDPVRAGGGILPRTPKSPLDLPALPTF